MKAKSRSTKPTVADLESLGADLPSKRRIAGKAVWFVRIPYAVLRRLSKLRAEVRSLRTRSKDLERENREHQEAIHNSALSRASILQALEAANQQLVRAGLIQLSSPQNYFGAAEKHGIKLHGLGMQGGHAGLEKK